MDRGYFYLFRILVFISQCTGLEALHGKLCDIDNARAQEESQKKIGMNSSLILLRDKGHAEYKLVLHDYMDRIVELFVR